MTLWGDIMKYLLRVDRIDPDANTTSAEDKRREEAKLRMWMARSEAARRLAELQTSDKR